MENKLYILGSSSALPTSHRFPTSLVLSINNKFFMLDCGEGTQIRIRQAKARMQKVNHIFISHLHGDHYLGIMGLISSLNLLGRKNDLHIYAFPDLKKIIDLQIKVTGLKLHFNIVFHNLADDKLNLILSNKTLDVYSFPLNHRIQTCGFLFKEKQKPPNIRKDFIAREDVSLDWFPRIKNGEDFINGKGKVYKNKDIVIPPPKPFSFAYCSDTIYDENIIKYINGIETLYHEATFCDDMKELAKEKYHSTAKEAAEIAKLSEAKQLIIGHFSARYRETEKFLKEAKEVFDNTYLAEDLRVISLNER